MVEKRCSSTFSRPAKRIFRKISFQVKLNKALGYWRYKPVSRLFKDNSTVTHQQNNEQ
ncbi:hypothetical protein [Spirosoma areae]